MDRLSSMFHLTRLLLPFILLLFPLSACQGRLTPTPQIPPAETVARSFLQAWEQGNYQAMYRLLVPDVQDAISEEEFIAAYSSAAKTMTLTCLTASLYSVLEEEESAKANFSVIFETLLAGSFRITNTLPLQLEGNHWGVLWSRACILPQLEGGNHLYLQPEVPMRGNIYDRSGRGLAVNGTRVVVGVVPEELEDADRALFLLSRVLGGSIASLREKYTSAPSHWFVPLGEISAQEGAQHYDTLADLPGVVLREKSVRSYRDGELAPHVVGYMRTIGAEEVEKWREKGYPPDAMVGKAGLEAWGEEFLAGRRGGMLMVVSPNGELISKLARRSPTRGRSIYTTLDRALQKRAVELLKEQRGAIVALDPHNGQVLALASSPTFDPSILIPPTSEEDWRKLTALPGQPLLNRATQGLYPPASVFKIVTMAAGMGTGFYTTSSTFECKGVWNGLGDEWPMYCWVWPGQHGTLDLVTGLEVSCDVVFYKIGLRLHQQDPGLLPSYARRFGLGKPTGLVGLPEATGLVPDDIWKPGDSVNLAIGQGDLLVTPLQIAVLISAVGNGGT
ncbi:MAG: penicillin-binding transpeptidase domain-containing protein, partial [Chloroflexota bacterium]|nr:penicillin-binding transpeptidase domain-containing protein [Chloroflexota bacterium]